MSAMTEYLAKIAEIVREIMALQDDNTVLRSKNEALLKRITLLDAQISDLEAQRTYLRARNDRPARVFPRCECGGIATDNASGDITRTCIRCGGIVYPLL